MKVIDRRPGVEDRFYKDDSEGTFTIQTIQDVNPILENNKRLQTLNDGYSPSRELKRVASIPATLVRKWCKDAGISFRRFMRRPAEFEKWLERKLTDPENQFLLTAPLKRPQPSGIIGLDDALRRGRAVRPPTRVKRIRATLADGLDSLRLEVRQWHKSLDDWLFDLQARMRGQWQ